MNEGSRLSERAVDKRAARGRRATVTIILVLAAMASVAAVVLLAIGRPDGAGGNAPTAQDMNGNQVELDPGESLTPAQHAQQDAASGGLGRFAIASVGLDVPLGAMNAVDGVVTPPGFTSAYLLRNYGVDLEHAHTGSVYIVMHSLRGGGTGPGNYLFDVDTASSRVSPGDVIQAGSRSYRVDGSMTVAKAQLADTASIWNRDAGSLVVITCLQQPSGAPSTSNFVVTATLAQ